MDEDVRWGAFGRVRSLLLGAPPTSMGPSGGGEYPDDKEQS